MNYFDQMIKMIKKPYPALTQSIVDLSCDLIARASVTPDDKGCQLILADLLKQAGYSLKPIMN